MEERQYEARELVKQFIKANLVEENLDRTIVWQGEEIRTSKEDEKSIRFDLPGRRKAYLLMSQRLYEKEFIIGESEVIKGVDRSSHIVEQLNYKGEVERVDTMEFKNKLVCECGNFRWVKNADLFQVRKCKPCTYKGRKERMERRRRSQ